MASVAADIFHRAAASNLEDPRRTGSTVELAGGCDVIVAGDIHGHRANLNKILAHAALGQGDNRRLVLQEIIHAPPDPRSGHDRSVDMLLRVARARLDHPAGMLFVLGNHDVAQITDNEITKDGHAVCKTFKEGVRYAFGDDADEVLDAIRQFLLSLPLVIRCPNRVMISHSLPSPKRTAQAGTDILRRPVLPDDLHRGHSAYEWTWGRGHTDEQLDELAATLGVDFFVIAHRQVEGGHEIIGRRAIAVASDHEHGSVVRFSTDQPLSADTVGHCVKQIVALGPPRPHGPDQAPT